MPPWEKYQFSTPTADGPWSKYGSTAPAPPAEPMTDREAWESSMPVRLLRGVEGPAISLLKMVGPDSIKQQLAEIDELRKRGMAKRGDAGGMDVAGLFGSLVPGSAIASGVTKALPAATSVLGKMGVGATAGAAAAGAQPLEGNNELSTDKLGQIAGGAVVGGVIPGAVEGVKAVGRLFDRATEPLTEAGRARILQRFQEKLIGDAPGARQRVVTALNQAREIVPGSQPTAAEAVAALPEGTGLAAHQKIISKMEGISPKFVERNAKQEAARLAALQPIAGTGDDSITAGAGADSLQHYKPERKPLTPCDIPRSRRPMLPAKPCLASNAQLQKLTKALAERRSNSPRSAHRCLRLTQMPCAQRWIFMACRLNRSCPNKKP